jgi:uncharacterized membrane protein YeaQ/YmgE (transglycosylase-associated protein family)
MGKFVLGTLLGVASLAFAQTAVNPLCSMIQALADNWGIITWLVVGILGVMVLAVGIVNLTAGKAAYSLVVVVGGAVILVATFRLMDAAGGELRRFAGTCQRAQIEFVKPVATIE